VKKRGGKNKNDDDDLNPQMDHKARKTAGMPKRAIPAIDKQIY